MNRIQQNTHSELKDGTDWLMIAKPKYWMTAVDKLLNVFTTPENAVAPRWRATFFTATFQPSRIHSQDRPTNITVLR